MALSRRASASADEVAAAVTFIKDKGALADDFFAQQRFALLRDPSSAGESSAYYFKCQARLLRLHDALRGGAREPHEETAPDDVHHFDPTEFPGYSTLLMVDDNTTRVQRLQRSRLCYMHACAVAHHYAVWHALLASGASSTSHGMLDLARYMATHFSGKQLEKHVFDDSGGNSPVLLRCILLPDSIVVTSREDVYEEDLRRYGPALVSSFEVHTDFENQAVHHHHGVPAGDALGIHSMVLVGARTDAAGKRVFLLQNWCAAALSRRVDARAGVWGGEEGGAAGVSLPHCA